MMNRDQIYMTNQFHESLEEKVRENLKRSLAALPERDGFNPERNRI